LNKRNQNGHNYKKISTTGYRDKIMEETDSAYQKRKDAF